MPISSSPLLERVMYVRKLQTALMKTLRMKENAMIQQRIKSLAIKNQNLLGADTASFRFDAKWYTADNIVIKWHEAGDYNARIHPSLLKEIAELLTKKSFVQMENSARIENLIGNILSSSRTIKDLRALLPIEALTGITLDSDIFDRGLSLTEIQREKIRGTNKKDLSHFRVLAMTKLLLPS